MKKDPLKIYQEKRNFDLTSEPMGGEVGSGNCIFVVQKHAARSLHYDLRLEVDGVLRSWAVPKGPSMDPRQKRLAVETEDHPIEYARFEGTIPEGQYGAGSVIVWDSGTYRNMTERDGRAIPMDEALNNGHAAFWLEGNKLKGGFALTRTQRGWILVKMKDELADSSTDILKAEPRSVKSGRTVEEVGNDL
ncbi:MAG: ATP-dependent DNA ligase [Methanosaeta sp. PtaU1.Bin060]|nr:MAG: ATP-dependent DNA ligase [Methanosaeta sp. PtaU1.Bin060]